MILNIPEGVDDVDKGKRRGGKGRFGRGSHDSLNRSTIHPNEANRSTCSTDSNNLPKFDKIKVKCYKCKKQ
jgi:hypothetical protein